MGFNRSRKKQKEAFGKEHLVGRNKAILAAVFRGDEGEITLQELVRLFLENLKK